MVLDVQQFVFQDSWQFGMLNGDVMSQHPVGGMQGSGASAATGSLHRALLLSDDKLSTQAGSRAGSALSSQCSTWARQGPCARGQCVVPEAPGAWVGDMENGGSLGGCVWGEARGADGK